MKQQELPIKSFRIRPPQIHKIKNTRINDKLKLIETKNQLTTIPPKSDLNKPTLDLYQTHITTILE